MRFYVQNLESSNLYWVEKKKLFKEKKIELNLCYIFTILVFNELYLFA